MTKSIILIIIGLLFYPIISKSQNTTPEGVDFLNIGYKKATKLAKKNGKILLVFVGSEHCDVCVRSRDVFRDDQIRELYKNRFVVIKMDPENLSNNVRLNNWGISKIPSLLFFNKKKIIYKSTGEQTKDSLLSHLSRVKI